MQRRKSFGVTATGFSSQPFVTSWLLQTYVLATIRLILSIYCFTTIFYSWAWFATHKVTYRLQDIDIAPTTFTVGGSDAIGRFFGYFAFLSYWGLGFYFAISAIHTFIYAKRSKTWLDRWPLLMQVLHSMFYSSVVTYPYLVSIIYWGSMYIGPWSKHDFDAWSSVSIHALNSAFATFEIGLTQTPPLPWLHLPALLLIMAMYLGVAYIMKTSAGVYVYLWLDPKVGVGKLVAHIIGYAMAMIVVFTLVRGAIWLRGRATRGFERRHLTCSAGVRVVEAAATLHFGQVGISKCTRWACSILALTNRIQGM